MPFVRLRTMADAQAHRGPDGRGYAVWQAGRRRPRVSRALSADVPSPGGGPIRLGLAHNLLAIQDTSAGALQPMSGAGGRLWISYNGEIYNFPELRAELEARDGIAFRTATDTEVLLALWERLGPRSLQRLRGMFAFVLYDVDEDTLWLARDRLGIKPLYYAELSVGLLAASEIRGLHASGLVPRRWNDEALRSFLAAGVNKPGDAITFFEDVRELPPGTVLRVRPGEVSAERYYHLPSVGAASLTAEALPEIRDRFTRTVALHLRSAREVGTCLSGGLDSSAIAVAAAGAAGSAADFQAFTIGRPRGGDVVLARLAAERLGVRHRVYTPPPTVPLADLFDMVRACETPNHTWGPINQYLLLRTIAQEHGLCVLLNGQGGDEVLSGYPWFVPAVSAFVAARFGEEAAASLRDGYAARAPLPPVPLGMAQAIYTSRRFWLRMCDGGAMRALGVGYDEVARWEPVLYYVNDELDWDGMRRQQLFRRELAHFLRHEDRLGMWFSIECRVPFVDHELVELLGDLDPRFLFQDGYAKYPLRALFPELPPALRWQTRKTGYWENYAEPEPLLPLARRAAQGCAALRSLVARPEAIDLTPAAAWRFLQIAALSDEVEAADLLTDLGPSGPVLRISGPAERPRAALSAEGATTC